MSLKSVPSQGPLRVVLIMCPTCGQVVLPTLTKARHGVSQIVFYHTNKEMGCAWKNSSSMERATGETLGLKESVRMGNDGKGQPLMVNEYELAEGKSFDVEGLRPFAMCRSYCAAESCRRRRCTAVDGAHNRTAADNCSGSRVSRRSSSPGRPGLYGVLNTLRQRRKTRSSSIGDPVPAGTASE